MQETSVESYMNTKEAEYNLLRNEIANLDEDINGAATINERNMLAAQLEKKEHEIFELGKLLVKIYKDFNIELDKRITNEGG